MMLYTKVMSGVNGEQASPQQILEKHKYVMCRKVTETGYHQGVDYWDRANQHILFIPGVGPINSANIEEVNLT